MKAAFSKIKSVLISVWRTVISTFVSKHIYSKDVDTDGVNEIVIDINGESNHSVSKEIKEEEE